MKSTPIFDLFVRPRVLAKNPVGEDRVGRAPGGRSRGVRLRRVQLVSLHENIDTTSTTGKLFFHIFGALAEPERNMIVERSEAGLAAARARRRNGGRQRILTIEKIVILDRLLGKSNDDRSHARKLGVSERTVRRYASKNY